MARPGDAVEFRSGHLGLHAPRNVGILLHRWRTKGVPWVRVWTAEGEREMKQEHLTKRAFRARYEGDLKDPEALAARLKVLLSAHGAGDLAEEAEDDLGRLEQHLWDAVCDKGRETWTEPELAQALYGADPSPVQVKQVRAALDRCRRAGTGRFQTAAGRGDTWRPWSRAEHDHMRSAWRDLEGLRSRLVQAQETEEGRVFSAVPLADAGLTDGDREALAWIERAMRQFVEHDGVPDGGEPVAGIGGLGATQAFGMDLHRALGFLAQDWIGADWHTTTSSDYVIFLLRTGLWTPPLAVEALVRRHVNQEPFFEHVPDPKAEAAAAAFGDPVPEPGRTDLRHLSCYTIDPPDAKDFDDAVGIEERPEGMRRLWVHVADVSHYVTPDSLLDRHARRRATSVYLPGRVLPMLPSRLSDHLCSLRDDGDRYALSVGIDVNPDGTTGAAQVHRALIRVTRNLHYGQALEAARAGQEPFASLMRLAADMRSHRKGLELETGELKVLLEATGFSALEKRADDATRMIETFMVAANEAVARRLDEAGVPVAFRCHPLPEPDKAERFGHQLESMGLGEPFPLPRPPRRSRDQGQTLLDLLKSQGGKLNLFGGGVESEALPAPEVEPEPLPGFLSLSPEEREAWLAPFRAVVGRLSAERDAGRAEVATLKLLACMGRAFYAAGNQGHFGLALAHYCHFTSPIRRYPDLIVHRNLAWLLAGGPGDPPHPKEALPALCEHCSNQERAADALERRIKSSCLVLATLDAESATARARITGITPTSTFVLRDDGIEARLWTRDLPGGPYQVDEWESRLLQAARAQDVGRWAAQAARAGDLSGGEERIVATLGDAVTARLAGRDVASGRTGAVLVSF